MQILLIGCGNMGSAMLSAWLNAGLITRAMIIDRHPNDIQQRFSTHQNLLSSYPNVNSLPTNINPDLVILAVKPQQMAAVLAELAPRLEPAWPVMTIAAGLRSEFYQKYLPENPIIRVMPNTPAMVGQGMTVATTTNALPAALKTKIEKLLLSNGDFFWLDNEDQLDAATTISGSGPAYFFYLAEKLATAGEAHGLAVEQALRLARQTLIGAGAIATVQTEKPLAQMRQDVTSPGGVTAATIAAWDKDDAFQNLIAAGIEANLNRSRELAKA